MMVGLANLPLRDPPGRPQAMVGTPESMADTLAFVPALLQLGVCFDVLASWTWILSCRSLSHERHRDGLRRRRDVGIQQPPAGHAQGPVWFRAGGGMGRSSAVGGGAVQQWRVGVVRLG